MPILQTRKLRHRNVNHSAKVTRSKQDELGFAPCSSRAYMRKTCSAPAFLYQGALRKHMRPSMIKTLGKERIGWHETGGPTSDGLSLKHEKESFRKTAVERRERSGL